MRLDEPRPVTVGARGTFELDAGYYLYAGGALNGLRGRLRRHRRTGDKKLYWHIDYLRAETNLVEIWWTISPVRLECDWIVTLRESLDAAEPITRFGSGDCNCSSHLIYFPHKPSFENFSAHWSDHDVHRTDLSATS